MKEIHGQIGSIQGPAAHGCVEPVGARACTGIDIATSRGAEPRQATRGARFATCAFLPRRADVRSCQTACPDHLVSAQPVCALIPMKKLKLKKPSGMALVLTLLSLLCITIYGAIAFGLASQIGKAPGVVHGVTADD